MVSLSLLFRLYKGRSCSAIICCWLEDRILVQTCDLWLKLSLCNLSLAHSPAALTPRVDAAFR